MLWTVGHTISFFVSFHPKRQKQFVQDPFEQIGGSFAAVDGKLKKMVIQQNVFLTSKFF